MKYSYIFLIQFLFAVSVFAKEPQMLLKGELLMKDDFDKGIDKRKWKVQGMTVKNGQLKWDSGAKIGPQGDISLRDHIVEYTFFCKGKSVYNQYLYNDHLGHAILFRMSSTTNYLMKWQDQDILNNFKEYPDVSGSTLKSGKVYTVVVETRGDEMLVHMDDENFLYGRNHRIDRDKKKLVISFGGAGTLDSIRIWEGKPNENWQSKRKSIIEQKKKRVPRDVKSDPEFEYKYGIASLQVSLRENNDLNYKKIIDQISSHMQDIKAKYPFFGGKETPKNKAAKRKANSDPVYKEMEKKLIALKKVELDYIMSKDTSIKPFRRVKKKPKK